MKTRTKPEPKTLLQLYEEGVFGQELNRPKLDGEGIRGDEPVDLTPRYLRSTGEA